MGRYGNKPTERQSGRWWPLEQAWPSILTIISPATSPPGVVLCRSHPFRLWIDHPGRGHARVLESSGYRCLPTFIPLCGGERCSVSLAGFTLTRSAWEPLSRTTSNNTHPAAAEVDYGYPQVLGAEQQHAPNPAHIPRADSRRGARGAAARRAILIARSSRLSGRVDVGELRRPNLK